jgi:hypothetical protein
MHFDFEAKHVGVKRNCSIDVVNYISNADITHGLSPPEICFEKPLHESFSRITSVQVSCWTPEFVCSGGKHFDCFTTSHERFARRTDDIPV